MYQGITESTFLGIVVYIHPTRHGIALAVCHHQLPRTAIVPDPIQQLQLPYLDPNHITGSNAYYTGLVLLNVHPEIDHGNSYSRESPFPTAHTSRRRAIAYHFRARSQPY
jgi:hypothetical protein